MCNVLWTIVFNFHFSTHSFQSQIVCFQISTMSIFSPNTIITLKTNFYEWHYDSCTCSHAINLKLSIYTMQKNDILWSAKFVHFLNVFFYITKVYSGHYNNLTGVLHSPNFPNDYPNRADSFYYITVDSGYVVHLQVTDFEAEFCCDYLKVNFALFFYCFLCTGEVLMQCIFFCKFNLFQMCLKQWNHRGEYIHVTLTLKMYKWNCATCLFSDHRNKTIWQSKI